MPKSRPVFRGQRLTLMDWQLNDLEQMLGAQVAHFDVLEFLTGLDGELVESGDIMPPQGEQHRWLQRAMFAEAVRRGLPVIGRQAHGWTFDCPHQPHCRTTGECVMKQKAAR